MPAFINLTGTRFGRLIAIQRVPGHRVTWRCKCDCGGTIETASYNLRMGSTKSCGCLQRERSASSAVERTVHGHATDAGLSPTYTSWMAMKARCGNPNHKYWKDYGGRGIKVCERWESFKNFLADMGERPPGKTLDRYPNADGNYEPGNCRWATWKQQRANRRDPNSSPRDALGRFAKETSCQ